MPGGDLLPLHVLEGGLAPHLCLRVTQLLTMPFEGDPAPSLVPEGDPALSLVPKGDPAPHPVPQSIPAPHHNPEGDPAPRLVLFLAA